MSESEMKPKHCKRCHAYFIPFSDLHDYCNPCNEILWKEWEIEHADEIKEIKKIRESGHSHHCACRQVWGDGECECDLYAKGYDPYWWMKSGYSRNY